MSESRIQNAIIKYLKTRHPGAIAWKIHEDPVFGVVGIPDVYFAWKGMSFWFEIKRPGGKRSAIQESRIKQLKANHIQAHFVESLDDVKDILCH